MPGAGVKILNNRIRSVKSTQQITKAMKMVAAAKLNRSQGKMLAARPYSQKLTKLVEHLAGPAPGGDLMVYYWMPGQDWKAVNVSSITGHI